MISRTWKIYGADGHRQRMSFRESFARDFSASGDIRILEVFNSDLTGTNDYTVLRITRNTADECERELFGQISDGIFEDCHCGIEEEIFGWDMTIPENPAVESSPAPAPAKVNDRRYIVEERYGDIFQTVFESLEDANIYAKRAWDSARRSGKSPDIGVVLVTLDDLADWAIDDNDNIDWCCYTSCTYPDAPYFDGGKMCGNPITIMREACGMRRTDFCEFFGIPYRTVEDWERGARSCPDYLLALIRYKLEREGYINPQE